MKILYFHQHFSTRSGATGTRSYEFSRRLLERGHRVTIVCGSMDLASTGIRDDSAGRIQRGIVDGIAVIRIRVPYSNTLGLLRRTVAFMSFAVVSAWVALTEPCDLVFATSAPLTAAIPGIVARLLRRKPFVFEARDLWPDLPKALGLRNPFVVWGMEFLEHTAYSLARACIGLSPGIIKGIASHGVAKGRIAMIPNASDIDLFDPEKRTTLDIPGISASDFVALFAGAHGPANGLESLLDVAAELKRQTLSKIKLLFVGDGKRKPTLVARAQDEGLDNCIFLDPMPKTQLASLMASVDVGIVALANVPAFYFGTSPNKFFDYIASGIPAIINHPGWLSQLVMSNECGVGVKPGDSRAFVEALIRLSGEPEVRQRMGDNARKLAEREFARDLLSARFVEVIETAFDTHRTGHLGIQSRPSSAQERHTRH